MFLLKIGTLQRRVDPIKHLCWTIFAKIANRRLIISQKIFILDVWRGSECTSARRVHQNKSQKFQHRHLTLSGRRSLSYRFQSIDLLCKLMDRCLYYRDLCHKRVNRVLNTALCRSGFVK